MNQLGNPGIFGDIWNTIKNTVKKGAKIGKDVIIDIVKAMPPINIDLPGERTGYPKTDIQKILEQFRQQPQQPTTTETTIEQPAAPSIDWNKILLIAGIGFVAVKLLEKD